MSRASVAGSHATMCIRFGFIPSRCRTACLPSPDRGGSARTKSGASRLCERYSSTEDRTASAFGTLCIKSATAAALDSTAVTRSKRLIIDHENKPTPAYKSTAFPPAASPRGSLNQADRPKIDLPEKKTYSLPEIPDSDGPVNVAGNAVRCPIEEGSRHRPLPSPEHSPVSLFHW